MCDELEGAHSRTAFQTSWCALLRHQFQFVSQALPRAETLANPAMHMVCIGCYS